MATIDSDVVRRFIENAYMPMKTDRMRLAQQQNVGPVNAYFVVEQLSRAIVDYVMLFVPNAIWEIAERRHVGDNAMPSTVAMVAWRNSQIFP
jgi:hypothetical protein